MGSDFNTKNTKTGTLSNMSLKNQNGELISLKISSVTPILIAPQTPEDAAKEIDDRANEDEFVSAFIPAGGLHPPLGDSRYDPIYDACSRNDLPIVMHSASGTQILNFPFQYHGTKRYMSNHAPTHVMTHMMHLTTLITQGVPVRYPNLKFVMQEAGLGWIPYMKKRLDNEYSEKKEDRRITLISTSIIPTSCAST